MKNLLFYNKEEIIQVERVKKLSDHLIQIWSEMEPNVAGFDILTDSGEAFGKYGDFTTLYKQEEGSFILSNDGSVWVEPEPEPESEPPSLEDIQEAKVAEMNEAQQSVVAQGCEVELSDGTKETFTLTTNDQLSLNALSVKSLEGMDTLPWHPADESVHCKFYSEEDMKKITDACMSWVTYHVTYFRDLRIYIRSLTDKEAIQSIQYGDSIPSEYQSEVLQALLLQMGGE